MTAVVWFRRDLRVHDHPALRAALDRHERVIPVFCLDDRILHGRHASGPRTQFLLECLHDLDASLTERGSGLVIRRDLSGLEFDELFVSEDVTPYARRRDAGLQGHPGLLVAMPERPYKVFSPFHRAWLREPRRPVLAAPRKMPPLHVDKGRIPTLEELGLKQEVEEPMPGGETAARERLSRFARQAYEHEKPEGTSRLSPYLHFGCLSPREVEERIDDERFRRQLAWRDFHHHVLLHHPDNQHTEFQERYRGMQWCENDHFEAWTQGMTGYPLVDAGMRQLLREGWMHNRARLVVGSFLTKDLGIDWRLGERWFMRLLIDGDEANNNGNWQWIASVGVDPQPAFKRMYNPARQQERFDPDGAYVRRYVPELAEVPLEYLSEPWRMPGAPPGYPEPIVDHKRARERALERYRAPG